LWLLAGGVLSFGCAGRHEPVEPVVVPNPTLGRLTIAVAPALNFSGSTDFDANRFADLMAGELSYAEHISVIPVSRVLGDLAGQGADRVESPTHASEIARRLGADAILVFAVTEYDPYDPPRVGISAQLFAAAPMGDQGEPATGVGAIETSSRPLTETQRRFDAAHADVADEIRSFARQRGADGSAYGWRKYVIRQLSLVKGEERFVFRYQQGQEPRVVDAFAELAANRESSFDWFDAAVLSYQMGRRLETELDQIAM
jgi:hypothetical protein